LNQNARMIFK